MTIRNMTVFFVSTLLLCLEFVEIRILAFSHWFHFVYFVITLGLLGFACSGTAIALSRKLKNIDEGKLNAICLIGFCVSALVGMRFGTTHVADTTILIQKMKGGNFMPFVRIYLVLMVALTLPFIFASLVLCRALTECGKNAALTYGLNLVGTALGAGLFLAGISPLGAYRLLYLVVLLAAVVGMLQNTKLRWVNGASAALLLLGIAGIAKPTLLFFPKMDYSKNLAGEYPNDVVETRWTPMFRVDMSHTNFGARITIDGDAQTWVYKLTPEILASKDPYVPDAEQVSRHAVFRAVPDASRTNSLVIGAGGGMDVLAAYQAGYRSVEAVDIDPVRIEWLKGKYSELLAGLFNKENVHTHVADGRSFIINADKKYDAIMLYNVDTLAGVTTGAYNLVENYLYTQEAFYDYVGKLSPTGVLQVTRHSWGGPTELKKLFNTLLVTCQHYNLDPRKHLLVAKNGEQLDTLISRSEFSEAQASTLMKMYQKYGYKEAKWMYAPEVRSVDTEPTLAELENAYFDGTMQKEYDKAETDIRPVTDDRPFFFENQRWDRGFNLFKISKIQLSNWSGIVLTTSLIISLVVISLLVFFSYWGVRKEIPALPQTLSAIVYFTAIGLGYMFVQMALIQRLTLVIGNPVVSMAIIIPTLLLSMGISSSLSSHKALMGLRSTLAVLVLPLLAISVQEFLVSTLFHPLASAQFSLRVASVVLSLIPVGICLGFCFPTGLRIFTGNGSAIAPLAWTANGGASVLGSIGAVLSSLVFGFHHTLMLAISCYSFAWIAGAAYLYWSTNLEQNERKASTGSVSWAA